MWESRINKKRVLSAYIQTETGLIPALDLYNQTKDGLRRWKKSAGFVVRILGESMVIRVAGNVTVDWGDGSTNIYSASVLPDSTKPNAYHKYKKNAYYIVTISGDLKDINFWAIDPVFSGTTYADARNLYQVLTPFPESMAEVTILRECFYMCKKLCWIPEDLFWNCPEVTDYGYCFAWAYLTYLPSKLFVRATKAEDFTYTFAYCFLRSLPERFFSCCHNTRSFRGTFLENHGLRSLPGSLFLGCSNAESFQDTFYYCSLTEIPNGLFDDCVSATDFSSVFCWNFNLTKFPIDLFSHCPNITTFNSLFLVNNYSVGKLTCEAPDLWNQYPNADGKFCFYRQFNMSNYDEIPSKWKS